MHKVSRVGDMQTINGIDLRNSTVGVLDSSTGNDMRGVSEMPLGYDMKSAQGNGDLRGDLTIKRKGFEA